MTNGQTPRPILILTASAGAGHGVAAEALCEQVARRLPDQPCEIHDVLDSSTRLFRRLYAGGYLDLVNHLPAAMGMLYDLTDRDGPPRRGGLRSAFQRINTRRTLRYIVSRRPRLIVNTHFLPAELVAELRRRGRLRCPQAIVMTDFAMHSIWAQAPAERYYAATEEAGAGLAACGVAPSAVRVTGIPLRGAFAGPLDRAHGRAQVGLDDDRPVVLLLCGGFGVGPTAKLFRELLRLGPEVLLVAITGRNARLAQRLGRLAGGRDDVLVIGYTDRMHTWLRVATLVVTKPGGLTAAESLACGAPLVLIHPIPGQEERNSDYLLENGAAIRVAHPRTLCYRVQALLADPARLQAMRCRAAALGRPNAAAAIVDDLVELLARESTG